MNVSLTFAMVVTIANQKAREETLGAAPSHLLLLRVLGDVTCNRTARNGAISNTALTKKDFIQSYYFFFFLSVVSFFACTGILE
jgi:hypothetical protein